MNVYFLLSQTGLALAAICGMGIIHITARSDATTRRVAYYYIAVWAVTLFCVFQFGDDAAKGLTLEQAQRVWKLRLLFGLERLAVYMSYRFAAGRQLSTVAVTTINRYVALSSVLILGGLLTYNAMNKPLDETIKEDIEVLSQQVATNGRIVAADTARAIELQKTIDKLTATAKQDSIDKVRLNRRVGELTAQISELADLLIELKFAIRNLGQNVERSRRSNINTPGNLSPRPTTGVITTDKVKPLPKDTPSPRRIRRSTAFWEDDIDSSAYYVQRQP